MWITNASAGAAAITQKLIANYANEFFNLFLIFLHFSILILDTGFLKKACVY